MRPSFVKNAVKSLPLALSQTRFAREFAHKLPPTIYNDTVKAALEVDYASVKDRDAALMTVTQSINSWVHQNTVAAFKQTSVGSEGIYNPALLQIYDNFVWEYNSPYLWRIESNEILDLYRECVGNSHNHCEIAVGTGYFLDAMVKERQLKIDTADDGSDENKITDTLTLMDLNPNTLEVCEQRLKVALATTNNGDGNDISLTKLHYDVVAGKVMDGGDTKAREHAYDSVAANFLFHCLHDDNKELETTRSAISNIRRLVHPKDGVFFGSTILGKDILEEDDNPSAKETLEKYNKWGIFGNQHDSFEGIAQLLDDHFNTVDVWRSGYCAVWKAKHPKLSA